MLIVKCNSLDKQEVTKDNKQTYAVSAVEKWNTSGKMLCFDISEENADVTSENHTVSITLANQSGDALVHFIFGHCLVVADIIDLVLHIQSMHAVKAGLALGLCRQIKIINGKFYGHLAGL